MSIEETTALLSETLLLTEPPRGSSESRQGNPLFALQLLHSWAMRGDCASRTAACVSEEALSKPASTTAELWEEQERPTHDLRRPPWPPRRLAATSGARC